MKRTGKSLAVISKYLAPVVLACLSYSVFAQSYPDKPIRLIVPFSPGGNVDVNARIFAAELQKEIGQSVIVENKAGAGGLIGVEYVSKERADGYTLLFTSNGPLIYAPVINKKPNLDWQKNFTPVTPVSFTPIVLQVKADSPIIGIQDLITEIKSNKQKYALGTSGAGGINHLESEMLQKQLGVSWLTVHYKGSGPAIVDLLGGQIQMTIDQVSIVQKYVKAGSTRAIAVMAPKRTPWLPDVPTLAEQGISRTDYIQTFTAVMAPVATPPAVVKRLSDASKRILQNPTTKKRFYDAGAEAEWMSSKDFSEYLRKEDATWIPIVKSMNISNE